MKSIKRAYSTPLTTIISLSPDCHLMWGLINASGEGGGVNLGGVPPVNPEPR